MPDMHVYYSRVKIASRCSAILVVESRGVLLYSVWRRVFLLRLLHVVARCLLELYFPENRECHLQIRFLLFI